MASHLKNPHQSFLAFGDLSLELGVGVAICSSWARCVLCVVCANTASGGRGALNHCPEGF